MKFKRLVGPSLWVLFTRGSEQHEAPSEYQDEASDRSDCAENFDVGDGERVQRAAENQNSESEEAERPASRVVVIRGPKQGDRMEEMI